MSQIILIAFFAFATVTVRAQLPAPSASIQNLDEIKKLTLDSLPSWADFYGSFKEQDGGYFNIDLVMSTFGLNRLQANQVQANFRANLRLTPSVDRVLIFNQALDQARQEKFEFINAARLASAKFIVVFDLDDTLYDQRISADDSSCADIKYTSVDGLVHYIKTAPHALEVITKINQLGGTVAIFSANKDQLTRDNLAAWKVGSTNLLNSNLISAVLANDSLVFQGGAKLMTVTTGSKDLRIFDEQLQKVMIVDDNPTRLFQWKSERLIRNFNGTQYCKNPLLKNAFDLSLENIYSEIEESVKYISNNPQTSFANAYLPYSMSGKLTVDWLLETNQMQSRILAIDYVRSHPDIINPRFP